MIPSSLGEVRVGMLVLPKGRRRSRLERWFEEGVQRLHCLPWDPFAREEKVLELQATKRRLADAIVRADESLIRDLRREDLELLLS